MEQFRMLEKGDFDTSNGRESRNIGSQFSTNENSPLLPEGRIALNYNSDSAMYDQESPRSRRGYYATGQYYGEGSSGDESDDMQDLLPMTYSQPTISGRASGKTGASKDSWKSKNKRDNSTPSKQQIVNRFTRRSRMRTIKKRFREPPSFQKLRVSAYCISDQLQLFKLLKWLNRVDSGQLPGGELNPNGWTHKMYMGAIHSTCVPASEHSYSDGNMIPIEYKQKDVFYFATGCIVFWGLTRTEEQAHVTALETFVIGRVKQMEVEDMDYVYGEASKVVNDAITLSSTRASEKLAIAFAMAQSSKLDVFEERVEETIRETKHIPQNLASTGSIQYSQGDISKLIGRLFIERTDVNLNSDMLDEPDFFWEDDEYEPLYRKMMKYLDVDNRVQILNTRLDILRELLDVLSQQLAHQHDTKLEWIVIWLIVAEVAVQVVWNILIKDILGFFPHSYTD